MSYRQTINPNLDPYYPTSSGSWLGWCLGVTAAAFAQGSPNGVIGRYPNTAQDEWNLNGAMNHAGSYDLPIGVWTPIFFSGYGGSGHVMMVFRRTDGVFEWWTSPRTAKYTADYGTASSMAELINYIKTNWSLWDGDYLGWSEGLEDMRVMEWVDDIPATPNATREQIDAITSKYLGRIFSDRNDEEAYVYYTNMTYDRALAEISASPEANEYAQKKNQSDSDDSALTPESGSSSEQTNEDSPSVPTSEAHNTDSGGDETNTEPGSQQDGAGKQDSNENEPEKIEPKEEEKQPMSAEDLEKVKSMASQNFKNIEEGMANLDEVTKADGWKGFFLPSWLYDILAMLNNLALILGAAYGVIAIVWNLPFGNEITATALVTALALTKFLQFCKLNYDKAKES